MEVRPLEETTLIAGACKGDINAYEELVRRHQGVAFRVAYLVLRDAGESEDVVQEAFVKAFYALSRFKAENPFRPWLLRIVTNEALNSLKASRRRSSLALRYVQARESEDAAPSPEAVALGFERRQHLARALDTLKDKERLVISLRFFLELSEQEMAEVLKCPRGTVKSRLNRALEHLRQVIKEHFPELEPVEEW